MKTKKNDKPRLRRGQKVNICLIILNGEINKQLLTDFINKQHPVIISADGASDFLYKHKIIPNYITGDLDSISNQSVKYFKRNKVEIIMDTDQDYSDFEKAINLAIYLKLKNICVIGYEGKRVDHTLNNISIMKKYYKKSEIKFIDTAYEAFFIKQKIKFKYPLLETISLLAMPKAGGIKTKGLIYPLANETLEMGRREGALNISNDTVVTIEFKTGCLLLFKKHFGIL